MPFVEFDGFRLLFIHIPKAGGSSVETWMRTLGELQFWSPSLIPPALKCTPQHLRRMEIDQLFSRNYFDYGFAIVRNPFTRIASEYRMRAMLAQEGAMPFPEFGPWLEHNLTLARNNSFHLDNHLRPQWQFTGNRTTLMRFEDGLETIIATVCKHIGRTPPETVPHELSSKGLGKAIEWDTSSIVHVAETYRSDFERFSYSIHEPPPD
ncbi:sulfotransferase family 2 domain-containing protein (plasmid) [Acuticoccus sp. MNP-M23]|uniref:sulfotransferase family 2 domain-containing protein n=1 Tax=Acuticoccus sp. MNP-M23 TaxID=3072793 RepID=UPI002815D73D|nr:sulfotransferase family 2 domain-containing protein [Acuticoccus sp. MNP-M23]WMS45362.1 sulfotransferase family 2 domain-containing protein [Acuticoccus sp. MNP-M23]